MCGIIGRVGSDVLKDIVDGLKNLEYRGYDSYGLCATRGGSHFLHKGVGIISRDFDTSNKEGFLAGIGHTRWATHGKVSVENAHPQCDEEETIFVVHNGTVENSPPSVLDTQHIVRSINQEALTEEDFVTTIRGVLQKLKGSNAFLVLHQNFPDRIFCAAKGTSSLIVTKNGYVSSDVNAIAGKAEEATRIENSVVCLCEDSILYDDNTNRNFQPVPKNSDSIEIDEPYYMLKEIKEQPKLIKKRDIETNETRPARINLIGCGSSYYAAMLGKIWFEEICEIPTTVTYGSEAIYGLNDAGATDIYISQSGETKDIIYAVENRQEQEVKNAYVITNNIDSHLANMGFNCVDISSGPEYGVAATKTFTMTCARLWEMAYNWKVTDSRRGIDGFLSGLSDGIERVLDRTEEIKSLAEELYEYDNFLFLGRHKDYPIALEGALKLKEISYIHAEGMPAAEMKHGPIALVDESTPSIFVVSGRSNLDPIISNMREIKSRGGLVVAICDNVCFDRIKDVADWTHGQYNVYGEDSKPLISNVVLQLFAYYVALKRNCNPDRPRNLAKSVTV